MTSTKSGFKKCFMKRYIILLLLVILYFISVNTLWAQQDQSNPRQIWSMDFDWKFHLGAIDYDKGWRKAKEFEKGPMAIDYYDAGWRTVDLPHDFVVEGQYDRTTRQESGYLPKDFGWYRKEFHIPAEDQNKRIYIEFDGVFRDCKVYLNNFFIGSHLSGYSSFYFDVTDFINYGGDNTIAVEVDARAYEGWWYEGGGIYRHVRLVKTDSLSVSPWGVYVTTESEKESDPAWADVKIETTVSNRYLEAVPCKVISTIKNSVGKTVAEMQTSSEIDRWADSLVKQKIRVNKPALWSAEAPNLYTLITKIIKDEQIVDTVETVFGIRTIRVEPDKGLFLNGQRIKLKGVCCHQDHACVGVALPDRVHEFRIEKVKQMGANSYRCSHNPPAPEILEACDRLGMLVIDETRVLSSSNEGLSQLRSLILRDRNHPSIIFWSIGNEEIKVQNTIEGRRIGRTMVELVRQLDPGRLITAAEDRSKADSIGLREVVDIKGINYDKHLYRSIHEGNPDLPLLATEIGATVTCRGVYETDPEKGYVHAYDEREKDVHWGPSAEKAWNAVASNDFLLGGFVWSGFDYRGEPQPFLWPQINSIYGIMDMCGFAKDNYYYYKSWWGDEPLVHIFPHWNWPNKLGESINVWCFSNCDEVELFLNGKSLGKKKMNHLSHLEWDVPYEPGELLAKGYKDGKLLLSDRVETTGPPAAVELVPDRNTINADSHDVVIITVRVVDEQGNVVPTAGNEVFFGVSDNAHILGVGNGDPSSHEPDKARKRRVFNGLAQLIVQTKDKPGNIEITATSNGLKSTKLNISTQPTERMPIIPTSAQ